MIRGQGFCMLMYTTMHTTLPTCRLGLLWKHCYFNSHILTHLLFSCAYWTQFISSDWKHSCKRYMEKRSTVFVSFGFFSSFYLNTYLQLKYFWVPGVSTFLHSQLCNPWQSQIPHPPPAPQIQWTLWKASCPNCLDNVLWWISCPTRAVYQLYSKESWLHRKTTRSTHINSYIINLLAAWMHRKLCGPFPFISIQSKW